MAGIDVQGCLSAIISCFEGGADLIQTIQERRVKKKRRKEDDAKQALREEMLQDALLDGAEKCRLASAERSERFGEAFCVGDAIATAELKDIMISLQMQVISILQVSRTGDGTVLNVAALHEAVIMNKNHAIRVVDYLCQRIMTSMADQMELSPAVGREEHGTPYLDQGGLQRSSLPAPNEAAASQRKPYSFDLSYIDRLSLHDAAISHLSPPADHRRTDSVASSAQSSGYKHPGASLGRLIYAAQPGEKLAPDRSVSVWSSTTASSSRSVTESIYSCDPHLPPEVFETAESAARAASSPQVVTRQYESLLSPRSPRFHSLQPPLGPDLRYIHPSRGESLEVSSDVFDEPDHIWSPLARSAKHNNYHNFCKGAWSSRQSLQAGLSILLLPNNMGVEIPHWKCKHCEFRSKVPNNTAPNDTTPLPDSISFDSRSSIRYRWTYLAKSHIAATESQDHNEYYSYGCIFCAAQGSATAVHKDLSSLLAHVVSKHRTSMMTPEVLQKTNCIVGGAPDKTKEWDVNVPESTGRRFTDTVGKFVVTSLTGLGSES